MLTVSSKVLSLSNEAVMLVCGAGLGLSVVRGIARLHEGTLMIESRAGSGTSARVSLSRRVGGAALGAPQPEGPADMGALLTGLADCLSPECFDARLLD